MRRTGVARLSFAATIVIGLALGVAGHPSAARPPKSEVSVKPSILLVHGAFADGTGWQHVIQILERDGYHVVAVQNPLISLAADVETTKRVIDAQTGSVVAVGHSYGGAVITGAAAGSAKVKALVYVAAFAPDAGEAIGALTGRYPNKFGEALRPDTAGFVTIDRAAFHNLFAQDVSVGEASVMAAAQKPIIGNVFASSVPQAAWRTIPSWYMVAKGDRAINPDLERFYAKRMGATTLEIDSSHVPFISRPREVARMIKEAARSAAAK